MNLFSKLNNVSGADKVTTQKKKDSVAQAHYFDRHLVN